MQAGGDFLAVTSPVVVKQEEDEEGCSEGADNYWKIELPGVTKSVKQDQVEFVLREVKLEPKDEDEEVLEGPLRESVVEVTENDTLYPEDLKQALDVLNDEVHQSIYRITRYMDPVVCLEQWQCQACGSCHPSPEWLKYHHQFDCTEQERYTPKSSASVKNKTKPASKIQKNADVMKTKAPKEGKKFKCSVCPYATNFRSNYDDHKAIHTGEMRYECKLCQKLFKCSAHRRRHMRSVHGPKISYTYRCKYCGKRYNDRRGTRRCELKHTNTRPYNCDQCGKGFIEKGDLARHMATHTREKPYPCPTCGKRFPFPYRVTRHLPVHSTIKPYCCGKCNKTYKTSSSLETHLLMCGSDLTPVKKR